jgi:mono/diheme cytochrome c family protein
MRLVALILVLLFTGATTAAPAMSAPAISVGRSLFDYQFPETIPYPFEKLVQQLSHVGEPVGVLVPLGRSLQRKAGAPEVFRYPRVVVGFKGGQIFVGYNEKARILEVISYNEEAGKFEFQVVHNYGPEQNSKAVYARRESCVACHQNQAPLFAVAPWDETQANGLVATRLKEALGKKYFGIPTESSQDAPYDLDTLTDQANMISVYQVAWAQLCVTTECRRDLFAAILKMRQERAVQIDEPSANRIHDFKKRWAHVWPKDLAIPNPDIPNRNPLDLKQSLDEMLEVGAEYEPLNLRSPLAVWSYSKENILRLFSGLAFLLPEKDLSELGAIDFKKITSRMSAASLAAPFDRVRLLREVYRLADKEYGVPSINWSPRITDNASEFLKSIEQKNQVGVFKRCASCHNNTMGFPPNFLYGELADVKGKIAHCAERIFYRLSMWHVPNERRGKTPMPPAPALEMREEDWERSNELHMIEDYIKKQLVQEGADVGGLLQKHFDQLRPCLDGRF